MIHGKNDHQIYNGTTTDTFRLMRDENGSPMYRIQNIVPQYRNPLRYTQDNWIGGDGEHTRATPDMYFEGQSIDTTQDGRIILGPLITEVKEDDASVLDTAPVKFIWFEAASKWLCATSGFIYLYTTVWTLATTTVANVTDMIEYEDIMYAGVGNSTKYWYSTDGDNWTQTDLTDGYANYWAVSPNPAGTAEVLWKAKTPNEVASTTDGRTLSPGVQWTTPNYIGDKSTDITNLFVHHDRLKIGKTSNSFHLDTAGGVHPERNDLEQNQSTDNFKYVADWQTGLYHSEIDGMGEITGNDYYEPMGPLTKVGQGPLGDIGKRGDIVGIAADKDWLYVAIDEGTNTHIYKGREVRKQGILRWEWCPWVALLTNTTATLATCQHSTTDRRLWFGYGASGTTTGYVILSDDPTADSAARFCAAGWVRMPYEYGTEAEWDKLWQSAVLEVVGGASGETVQIKYRKDTDTSATSCIAAAITNGIFETNFASALNCERIQFEIHLASNTNTATPEVSYFQAKGVEKPVRVRVHEMVYAIGDEPTNRAKTLRNFFRTARTATTLLKFADLRFNETTGGTAGTDYVYCVMEPDSPEQVEIQTRKDGSKELGMKVRLREVSFA